MGSLKVREKKKFPVFTFFFFDPAVCGRVYVLYGI